MFALVDERIDRWQREIPGTASYDVQRLVLSDMINALSEVGYVTVNANGEEGEVYSSSTAQLLSAATSQDDGADTPLSMRKVLRQHLGILLWMLDQREVITENESEIADTARRVHTVLKECLERLKVLEKSSESTNSESPRQAYPG